MDKAHKRLEAWKLSMDLAIEIYRATEKFPDREMYGLNSQTRRAAVSVPSNIAEGAARHTKKEFANSLHIARGSLSELDTQVEIAGLLGLVDDQEQISLNEKMERIDKMITGLIRHVTRK